MTVFTPLVGRWGNKLFQYCFAKAFAKQKGYQLIIPSWEDGRNMFYLDGITGDTGDIVLTGYAQDQASMIYTREEAKEWLRFRTPIVQSEEILCHRRVGDYFSAGYVVVSHQSYLDAAEQFGFDPKELQFVTEEQNPNGYLQDFRRLTSAKVLFRGNSSFSWWAATLGNSRVFAPIIEGLQGGKEQHCKFVEGNWPRCANLEFVTDLHLK